MVLTPRKISIRSSHERDVRCDFNACTLVTADILLNKKEVGRIESILIDRRSIPEGCFFEAMDAHSGDMQRAACAIYEAKYGRTILESLAEYDDDESFDILYISKMHVDDKHKQDGNSDVGAMALRELFRHPLLKGKICSAFYLLDHKEAMSPEQRRQEDAWREVRLRRTAKRFRGEGERATRETLKRKKADDDRFHAYNRADANQFLRNGFFQDAALARNDERCLLVACFPHGELQSLKTHEEVTKIKFFDPSTGKAPEPEGEDLEIQLAVRNYCEGTQGQNIIDPFGMMKKEIVDLCMKGASLSRSRAIHLAVSRNKAEVVELLLKIDKGVVNSTNVDYKTPLMLAANNAAGRCSINGISETKVLDMLLRAGADKTIQDKQGLTAYGHWAKMQRCRMGFMLLMTGSLVNGNGQSSEDAVSRKLLPPGGPTESDKMGGYTPGFVRYANQDHDFSDDETI